MQSNRSTISSIAFTFVDDPGHYALVPWAFQKSVEYDNHGNQGIFMGILYRCTNILFPFRLFIHCLPWCWERMTDVQKNWSMTLWICIFCADLPSPQQFLGCFEIKISRPWTWTPGDESSWEERPGGWHTSLENLRGGHEDVWSIFVFFLNFCPDLMSDIYRTFIFKFSFLTCCWCKHRM